MDTPTVRHSRRIAVVIAALFAVTSTASLAQPSSAFGWDANSFSTSSASALVSLTNRARANAGLRSLKVDATLSSVARWRSKDMITRDYFSHTIPGYGKVWDKLHAIGYCYTVAGENIGWNTYPDDTATAAIQDMFMGSPGHRANILGKAWDVVGIGAYKGPTGKKMWTVLFADKCGSTAPKATPRPTAKPKPKPRPTARPTARPTERPKAVIMVAPKPTHRPTPTPKVTPMPTPTPALSPTMRSPRWEPSVLASPRPAIGLGLSAEANGRGPGGVNGGGRSTDIDSALAFSVGLLTASLVALTAWALQLRRSTNARGQSRSID